MTRHRPTCPDCGSPLFDHGIGSYEFWGQRSVHHDWQCENPDCPTAPQDAQPEEELELPDDPPN